MALHPMCKVRLPLLCDFNANSCTSYNEEPQLGSNCVSQLAASTLLLLPLFTSSHRLPVFVTAAHHRRSLSLETTLIGWIVLPQTNKVRHLLPDGSLRI